MYMICRRRTTARRASGQSAPRNREPRRYRGELSFAALPGPVGRRARLPSPCCKSSLLARLVVLAHSKPGCPAARRIAAIAYTPSFAGSTWAMYLPLHVFYWKPRDRGRHTRVARRDRLLVFSLHHHDEENSAFVPAAEPVWSGYR